LGLPAPVGNITSRSSRRIRAFILHERWKRSRKVDTVVTLEYVGL